MTLTRMGAGLHDPHDGAMGGGELRGDGKTVIVEIGSVLVGKTADGTGESDRSDAMCRDSRGGHYCYIKGHEEHSKRAGKSGPRSGTGIGDKTIGRCAAGDAVDGKRLIGLIVQNSLAGADTIRAVVRDGGARGVSRYPVI